MSANPKIKTVTDLAAVTQSTPEQMKAKIAERNALRLKQMELDRELQEYDNLKKAESEGQRKALRFEAFEVRQEMEPLQKRNDAIIQEHTNLLYDGAENVPLNENGERVEAKIKFSAEEKQEFANRLANERAAKRNTK